MKTVAIIGSSIAGMTTAKIFSEHVDQVYVLERNVLSTIRQPDARKGVPQAKHVHVLLSKGADIIQEIFPETRERLDALGGFKVDIGPDMRWYQNHQWKSTKVTDVISFSQRRPTLDFVVYNQLREIENVKIMEGVTVKDLIYRKDQNKVEGLIYQVDQSEELHELNVDLVIDCSGRGSKTERWFETHKIGEVEKLEIPINVRYTSRYYELPPDIDRFLNVYITPEAPKSSRMALMMRAEDRVIITMGGNLGDLAPSDDEGFLEFAKSLDHPAIYNALQYLKPVSDYMTFNYPASRRKLYNKMKNFPDGYLVMGDAYTSFNPIYGQGMTSACMQAYTIKEILEKRSLDLSVLHKKFYKKSHHIVETAWSLSTAEDLRYPVDGPRPFALKILHPFSKMIIETSHNSYVFKTFAEVFNFQKGMAALFAPKFLYHLIKTKIFGNNDLADQIEDELEEMYGMLKESQGKSEEVVEAVVKS